MLSEATERSVSKPSAGPADVPKACWILFNAAYFLLPLISALSALILLGLGIYLAVRRKRIEVLVPAKSWSLLMVVVALSVCTSVTPVVSSAAILLFGGYFTVIWVSGLILDTPERVWRLCRNLFWSTVGFAILGIYLVFTKTWWVYQQGGITIQLGTSDFRAASVFYHPNIFSAYLLLVSGLGLMLLIHDRGLKRYGIAGGLSLIMLAQVLTASRSGWIGTAATLALIGLLVDRRILIALFGGMTVSLMAFWQVLLPRLQSLLNADFQSNRNRVLVWKSALAMIRERPLTGWGPGSWPVVYPKFENPEILESLPHAHNMYLMIGAEFGLIVLLVLLGVFLSLVIKTIRATAETPWRRHVVVLGCTIVGYLVVGLFDFIFTEGRNSILFFSMLGMLVAIRKFKPKPQRAVSRVLFVSNGYGEDRIAVAIARRWSAPNTELWAFPIVGEGRAYRSAGIPVVGPTREMPSGGFSLRSRRGLWADLSEGLLGLAVRQFLAIRALRDEVDLVVAVGDVVPLYFSWLSNARYVFVGCAKSSQYLVGSLSHYNALERWYMQHPRCLAIYPRDASTYQTLSAADFRVHDFGNPMMDDLEASGHPWPVDANAWRIGILPGSREEAMANLSDLLECCQAIAERAPHGRAVDFYAAIADSLDIRRLARAATARGWVLDASEEQLVGPNRLTLRLCRGQFGDWISTVQLVVGMAGTANEQCVGRGLPVVTFPGKGPQFNAAFAQCQARLLGESVSLLPADPAEVASEVWAILLDPVRLERIAQNGRVRMGAPGASEAISSHASRFL
ncbi:MAG TPA: lipid-A-disaccharide synthase-related protein [Stenomitos sp.]